MNWNPVQAIFEQSLRTPEQLALHADGVELSYADLIRRVERLAAVLREHGIGRGSRVGILGSRSMIAIEAVLGVAWCGATYVPLGLRWPEERMKAVIALTNLDAMIVDNTGASLITSATLATQVIVLPTREAMRRLPDTAERIVLTLEALPEVEDVFEPMVTSPDDLAYVIFTSGTTGVPKGVMVANASVAAYLAALGERKGMTKEDRASQFTELSFDPSLGEIFVPLSVGASLHIVPSVSHVSPVHFIREQQLSVWGSTPAAIAWMRDTRALQPGSLAGLRYSSFGGEPLPLSLVDVWRAAAPNSIVDNLYGPRRLSIAPDSTSRRGRCRL